MPSESPDKKPPFNPLKDALKETAKAWFGAFHRKWKENPASLKSFLIAASVGAIAGTALMLATPQIIGALGSHFGWFAKFLTAAGQTDWMLPVLGAGAGLATNTGIVVARSVSNDAKESRRRRREAKNLRDLAGPVEKIRKNELNRSNNYIFIRNGDVKSLSMGLGDCSRIEIPQGVTSMRDTVFAYNSPAIRTITLPSSCMEVSFDKAPGNIVWGFSDDEARERFCMKMEFRPDGRGGGTHLYNGKAVRIKGDTYLSHIAAVESLDPSREKGRRWWGSDPDAGLMSLKAVKRARNALIEAKRLSAEDRLSLADECHVLTRLGQMKIGEFVALLEALDIPRARYREKHDVIRINGRNEAEYREWHMIRWKTKDLPPGQDRNPGARPLRGPVLMEDMINRKLSLRKEAEQKAELDRELARIRRREEETEKAFEKYKDTRPGKLSDKMREVERHWGTEIRTEVERRLREKYARDAERKHIRRGMEARHR